MPLALQSGIILEEKATELPAVARMLEGDNQCHDGARMFRAKRLRKEMELMEWGLCVQSEIVSEEMAMLPIIPLKRECKFRKWKIKLSN